MRILKAILEAEILLHLNSLAQNMLTVFSNPDVTGRVTPRRRRSHSASGAVPHMVEVARKEPVSISGRSGSVI